MNRERQEIVIIEMFERADDELTVGNISGAQQLLRQGIRTLDVYAQEGIWLDRAKRLGLNAPSVVRSLAEYRRDRGRLTGGNPVSRQVPTVGRAAVGSIAQEMSAGGVPCVVIHPRLQLDNPESAPADGDSNPTEHGPVNGNCNTGTTHRFGKTVSRQVHALRESIHRKDSTG